MNNKKDFFTKASWIWNNKALERDAYAEFFDCFETKKGSIKINISVDSAYAIYIDNRLIKFMECSDFPNDKYVDSFEHKVNHGMHNLIIKCWHMGESFHRYYKSNAGLIFEIKQGTKTLSFSSPSTQSRIMNEFVNGYEKKINTQNGFTFKYDFNQKKGTYTNSILVSKGNNFSLRKINQISLLKRRQIKYSNNQNSIIVDFGEEIAGIADLDFVSPCKQDISVYFSEFLVNGSAKDAYPSPRRYFAFDLIAKKGRNKLLNPLKRIGARYLEVICENPIEINYLGLREVKYKHKVKKYDFHDVKINNIYRICLRTLECCMHEHYEDCPHREQSLYSQDARNQMLCGYYAFNGFEYQRHNLLLLSKSIQESGLLAITSPTDLKVAIPSFSLEYFQTVYEYIHYTKDKSVLTQIKPVLDTILITFKQRVQPNHLLKHFELPYWNFYEWTEGSHFNEECVNKSLSGDNQYDLILNCLYVLTLKYYEKLFNVKTNYQEVLIGIKNTFYDKEKGVYFLTTNNKRYSQLGNALACLVGLGNKTLIDKIIHDKDMIPATLAARGYVYDALLTEGDNYNSYIINDIVTRYQKMVDAGATTFWETELGKDDTTGGSLCHGWSALPIYYFSILLNK